MPSGQQRSEEGQPRVASLASLASGASRALEAEEQDVVMGGETRPDDDNNGRESGGHRDDEESGEVEEEQDGGPDYGSSSSGGGPGYAHERDEPMQMIGSEPGFTLRVAPPANDFPGLGAPGVNPLHSHDGPGGWLNLRIGGRGGVGGASGGGRDFLGEPKGAQRSALAGGDVPRLRPVQALEQIEEDQVDASGCEEQVTLAHWHHVSKRVRDKITGQPGWEDDLMWSGLPLQDLIESKTEEALESLEFLKGSLAPQILRGCPGGYVVTVRKLLDDLLEDPPSLVTLTSNLRVRIRKLLRVGFGEICARLDALQVQYHSRRAIILQTYQRGLVQNPHSVLSQRPRERPQEAADPENLARSQHRSHLQQVTQLWVDVESICPELAASGGAKSCRSTQFEQDPFGVGLTNHLLHLSATLLKKPRPLLFIGDDMNREAQYLRVTEQLEHKDHADSLGLRESRQRLAMLEQELSLHKVDPHERLRALHAYGEGQARQFLAERRRRECQEQMRSDQLRRSLADASRALRVEADRITRHIQGAVDERVSRERENAASLVRQRLARSGRHTANLRNMIVVQGDLFHPIAAPLERLFRTLKGVTGDLVDLAHCLQAHRDCALIIALEKTLHQVTASQDGSEESGEAEETDETG